MRKTPASSKTLSRSIVVPFKALDNRQDCAMSENVFEGLYDDAVRRLQVEMDLLKREFFLEREQRTADTVTAHHRIAEISKQNIQRYDSLKEIFTDIESNLNERLIEGEGKIEQLYNSKASTQSNIDFLFKKTWELDTAMGDLSARNDSYEQNPAIQELQVNGIQLKQEIEFVKQYLQKIEQSPSKSIDENISLRLQAIEEEIRDLAYRSEPLFKTNEAVYKLIEEHQSVNQILKEHEQAIDNFNQRQECRLEEICNYIDQQWERRIEAKLGKIINSYNTNFQELEETNLDIKDILEEVISVNGNLSQKLLSVIASKLDIAAFKETISSLSTQFTQTLSLNYQKINEIRDKEYEVEHQLRSLRDILDRHDFDRNTTRSVQRDIEESPTNNDCQLPFLVSPRNASRKLRLSMHSRSKSNFQEMDSQKC